MGRHPRPREPRRAVDRRRHREARRRAGGDRRRPQPAPAAVDALELVDIDYDTLPVVLDLEEAVKEGSALVHGAPESNTSYHFVFDAGEAGTGADTDQAFADADVVVSRRLPAAADPVVHGAPLVVVQPLGDNYTMWSSTQIPHILRVMAAMTTGIPEHKLRVVAPDVGGGFGGKLAVQPEEILMLLVARRLGKPVKWTETRSESLMNAHHGRGQVQYIDIAADREGNVKGLRVRLLADMGAYLRLITAGMPVLGAFMFPAIYKFPAYRFECDGVFTNKVPTDAYRGAGRPEATFAIERIMDELAVELGMDPLELRRKNWINADEFPFTTVAGLQYDSGDYETATQQALDLIGYDELRAEQQRRRESNDPVQLGIGFSTFTEMCGLAPSRVLGSLSFGAGGWEQASIRMLPTGKVEVVTGSSPHGQGHETAWSQLVADELGVAVRGRRGAARRHLDLPPRPGHLRLAVAGGGRQRGGQGGGEGGREGAHHRRPPARGQRGRPRLHRREVLGAGHARRRRRASRRSPWPSSRRTTTRRASSPRSTRRRRSTRSTSPSPTARTSAPWRSTPRPAWSRSASTPASTTSGRS